MLYSFIYFFISKNKGSSQNVNIGFHESIETVDLSTCKLKVKFQGGFVGSILHLSMFDSSGEEVYKNIFYPDDVNDIQTFPLLIGDKSNDTLRNIKKLAILFEKSSDFFGRIIIYHLEMFL